MEWMELLKDIFQLCILPLLIVVAKYVVSYINAKAEELKAETDSEIAKKYIDMLNSTVTECIIATNQTYVDNMKNKDAFDEEAQKAAFNKTLAAVKALLTDDAHKYLKEMYGDIDALIGTKIESQIENCKY